MTKRFSGINVFKSVLTKFGVISVKIICVSEIASNNVERFQWLRVTLLAVYHKN